MPTFFKVFFILWLLAAAGAFFGHSGFGLAGYLLGLPFAAAILSLIVVAIIYWIKKDKPFSKSTNV